MKTTTKVLLCLLIISMAGLSFGQSAGTTQPTKKTKKHAHAQKNKAIDNKIAVSDQAQPGEKSKKKPTTAKKDKAVSNK